MSLYSFKTLTVLLMDSFSFTAVAVLDFVPNASVSVTFYLSFNADCASKLVEALS